MNTISYVVSAMLVSTAVFAADGSWSVDADGNWSVSGSWLSGAIADGVDATATFPDLFTLDRTVTLDSSRVLGNIISQDVDSALQIQSNVLTLDVTAGAPQITTVQGLTLACIIAGNDGLTKSGAGTLNLSGANTFTGNITILGGTFRVGTGGAGSLAGGMFTNDIAMSAGTDLWIGSSDDHAFSGVISGGGDLVKSANGTMTLLSTNNTYTGRTTIKPEKVGVGGGTLSVMSFNSVFTDVQLGTVHLPSSSLGAPTTTASGTIDVGGPVQNDVIVLKYIGPGEITDRIIRVTFNASRNRSLDASGSGQITFTSDIISIGQAGNIVLTGTNAGEVAGTIPLNGQAGVEKRGTGTWVLSGINTYAGQTTVTSGTLIGDATNAFGHSAVLINGGQLIANATHSLTNTSIEVDGGTLVVAGVDCLGDTNRVDVTSGSVQLNLGVQEVVGTLWLGGIEQPLGTYGSSSSRAFYKNDAYFSGTGVLYVGVELPPGGTVIELF